MPEPPNIPLQGLLTHPQAISDEDKADKAEEHEVELFKTREDSTVALEATEQVLDLIAALVHSG